MGDGFANWCMRKILSESKIDRITCDHEAS